LPLFKVGAEGCECYDVINNQWRAIAPMLQTVTNCSVTSCGGKIYSIGCIINTEKIIIQSYDPETGILCNSKVYNVRIKLGTPH